MTVNYALRVGMQQYSCFEVIALYDCSSLHKGVDNYLYSVSVSLPLSLSHTIVAIHAFVCEV